MAPPTSPPLAMLPQLSAAQLRTLWPQWFDHPPPARVRRDLLARGLAYRMQERASRGLSAATRKQLRALAVALTELPDRAVVAAPRLTPGTRLVRQWRNETHQVTVEEVGFAYRGRRYRSLSEIARHITGTRWSGPAFFGLKAAATGRADSRHGI